MVDTKNLKEIFLKPDGFVKSVEEKVVGSVIIVEKFMKQVSKN